MTTNKDGHSVKGKESERQRIKDEVAAFLSNGGVIDVSNSEPATIKNNMQEVAADNWI